MAVEETCRHYSSRTVNTELVQRCRLDANEKTPFACPDGCVFFEPRNISDAGWQQ